MSIRINRLAINNSLNMLYTVFITIIFNYFDKITYTFFQKNKKYGIPIKNYYYIYPTTFMLIRLLQ